MNLRRRRHRRPRLARTTLSIYDPIPFGIDENGQPVAVTLMYRNLLAGGEPGSGKSVTAEHDHRPRRALQRM